MTTGKDDRQLQTQWYRVSSRLKAEIGDSAYENWMEPVTVSGLSGAEVRLAVPSRFMRDWVVANYLDRLKELWAGENSGVHSVDVIIKATRKSKKSEMDKDQIDRLPSENRKRLDHLPGGRY